MKKETVRTMILMMLCAVGGLLLGFNAGHLSNGPNIALFVIGIGVISISLTFMELLQTVRKQKNNH